MRWFFVGVVALNIAYLVWHLQAGGGAPDDSVVVAVEPAAFPASLRLLDERDGTPYAMTSESRADVVVLPGCPAVGPLGGDDLSRVVAALEGAGFPAAIHEVPAPGALVYWVYLPPAASRETAMRRLRELHARGIDSFVVAEGPYAHAISLGSFQSKDSAVGVQGRLRTAGYQAEVQEQRRDLRQNWVVLDEPEAQGFVEHLPKGLAETIRIERLPCDPR